MMKIMYTVLHSRYEQLNVVRYLVNEAHCDPHVKDNDGWTPLHYACRWVPHDVVITHMLDDCYVAELGAPCLHKVAYRKW